MRPSPKATGTTAKRIRALLDQPEDETNRPRQHRTKEGDALTDLGKLAVNAASHQERLKYWVIKAAEHNWPVQDIAGIARLSEGDIERIAAEPLEERRLRAAKRCTFCERDWDTVSEHCQPADIHREAYEARLESAQSDRARVVEDYLGNYEADEAKRAADLEAA